LAGEITVKKQRKGESMDYRYLPPQIGEKLLSMGPEEA
jgi:hypothetical protein